MQNIRRDTCTRKFLEAFCVHMQIFKNLQLFESFQKSKNHCNGIFRRLRDGAEVLLELLLRLPEGLKSVSPVEAVLQVPLHVLLLQGEEHSLVS